MQKKYWFEAVGDLGDFLFGQTSRSHWLLGDAFAVWRVVARIAALADSSSRTFTTRLVFVGDYGDEPVVLA